jgi:hypothetical protein
VPKLNNNNNNNKEKNSPSAGDPRPIILDTWEDEIWRITIEGQLGQIVPETLSQNNQSKMD